MTIFDYSVLSIIGFSLFIGLMRGAVREFFSIAGWVLAFYAATTWNIDVVAYLPTQIPGHTIKVIVAFILVFLGTLFVCSVASTLMTSVIKSTGWGSMNSILGGLVGALRGLLLVCVLVMLAAMTDLPKDQRWANAMLSAPVEALVTQLLPWVPESIRQHVHLEKPVAASDL